MSGAGVEVWRGGVATWETDMNGHLNVAFYVAKAMEALGGAAAALGMPGAFGPTAASTLLVKEHHLRFLKEAQPAAPLHITAGVAEIGETDARLLLLMRHGSGELAASFMTRVAHVTARELRPFSWPERVRLRAEALKVEAPAKAKARSIDLSPVDSQASLARAEALGLKRTGLGMVQPGDCDAFGRMRAEQVMFRISRSVIHLWDGRPPRAEGAEDGARLGGAVVEYRLLYHAWPGAGDRVEVRSAFSRAEPDRRHMIHWLLDPDSGRCWASAETVAVSFDLASRKMVRIADADVARMRAALVPGLTL